MDHLESFIADCDRRTEQAKKRLAETQEEISAEVSAKVSDWSYRTCEVFIFHTVTVFLCMCAALICILGREGARAERGNR